RKAQSKDWAFRFICCLSVNALLAVYGGRPARHPPGRCFATFKSAPGGFVLVGRVFTDKQQIKRKAIRKDGLFA
ncbi:hypothetical protein ACUOCP_47665, partial [Escherichia sp. R-CC3]